MKKKSVTLFATNRQASFQYSLETRYEAGLVLEGWEVISIRKAQVSLNASYISIRDGEAYLIGCQITPAKTITNLNVNPERDKKLLLHRKELNKLLGATAQKGMAIVPVKLYLKKGRIKLEIALAKGKKAHDKRQVIKERDIQRDQMRSFKDERHS